MKSHILACRDESVRYARVARWWYIRALNYQGDQAKRAHETAKHYSIKASAALALMQLEIEDACHG